MAEQQAFDPQVRIPRNSATNSTGKLPANPPESCHRFQMKVATQSGSKLPPEIGA